TAEEVFGKKGYFEASIVDITKEAEVAQGTFYKYFPSKKAIYDELVRELSRDLRQYIKRSIQESKNHDEAQKKGFQAFFEWVRDNRNLYSIVQQAVIVDEELYRWYYEKLAAGYVKSLNEAQLAGDFKELDKETIAYCLMGIGQFLGMRWVYWEGKEVPNEVFEAAMEMVFSGLKK
ncbi:MAG TPA: TetR/AcrR family transcriptional regulator, partial [Bacilli bacterium]|nr:TetR/AcrR family transcriptional regulator [Bacilli bacterium]